MRLLARRHPPVDRPHRPYKTYAPHERRPGEALESRHGLTCRLAALALLLAFSLASDGAPWAVPDAPLRAVVKAKSDPTSPDFGFLIDLPELGHSMPGMGDVVLLDAAGKDLALSKIWRGEGDRLLLLAQKLPPGQECYVYYGGNLHRRATPWFSKTSLLLETRRLPAGTKLVDWKNVEAAWKRANEVDGAGFVPAIDHGANPFGDSANFISHYTGWLKTEHKKPVLYTLSSDASFVLVGEKLEFGWPGQHNALANLKTAARKEIAMPLAGVRIDYYQVKMGESEPAMRLGWLQDDQPVTVPASAWAHPGSTELARIEHIQGWPVPQAAIVLQSYIGWGGLWLYETRAALSGGPLPAGWTATWDWSDGALFTGENCERIVPGPAPLQVTVRLKGEKGEVRTLTRLAFGGAPPRQAETSNPADLARYLELLDAEETGKLSVERLRDTLPFLAEFGNDQQLGKWAVAWLAKNPVVEEPLWLKAQLGRIRALAQTNPRQALAELRKIEGAARKKYAAELAMLELELEVFYLKDPAAVQSAGRIIAENPAGEPARLASIRVGDLYRLLGRIKEAADQYRGIQKTIEDETRGRKFAAEDRSYSITIAGMISQGYRQESLAKLAEWELEHPMGKFESDFLLLRARVLMLYGRWNEALQEIDSYQGINPDSPFQIPANFYRARALFELGKKEEARKIWQEMTLQYPKHELTPEAEKWARK